MVYIQSWQEYQDAAEALYSRSPEKTRYCVKWRGVKGQLVLKITDNEQCLKFKTYSSIFLNRFEALNLSLLQKMQNRRPAPPPPASDPAVSQTGPISTGGAAVPSQADPSLPSAPSGSTPAASSGVKKKKQKKKK